MAHIVRDGITKSAASGFGWPSYSYSELAGLRRKADKGDPVAAVRLAELPLPERRLARYVLDVFVGKGKKKKKAVCLSCGAVQNPDHDHCPECGEPLPDGAPRADVFRERKNMGGRKKALKSLRRYERAVKGADYVVKGWAPPTAHGRSCRCVQCTDPAVREAARKAAGG